MKIREIEWTDDLLIGDTLIDEQHKMLVEHLNNLTHAITHQLGPEKIAETLGFLIDYTDTHFSSEEDHMAAQGYPGLQVQKELHTKFRETLDDMERDFREEGATPELAEAIDTLLANWLVKHIQGVDAEFGAFLNSKGISLG